MNQYKYASETPIELRNNGTRIAGFLCTPENLADLALGHLLTRGLITNPKEVTDILVNLDLGVVDVITPQPLGKELFSIPEFVICGNSTVSNFNSNICRIPRKEDGLTLPLSLLQETARFMTNSAPLYNETGGIHTAVVRQGDEMILREDIGRHSAVDKAIGASVGKMDFTQSFICTTGRISLDMLLKCSAVDIPLIVSLKVISSMAAELGEQYNVTIVGHILGKEPTIYTAPQRVIMDLEG